jgi:hypothetical protein
VSVVVGVVEELTAPRQAVKVDLGGRSNVVLSQPQEDRLSLILLAALALVFRQGTMETMVVILSLVVL